MVTIQTKGLQIFLTTLARKKDVVVCVVFLMCSILQQDSVLCVDAQTAQD